MNIKKMKHWNGDMSKLPVTYLNNVIEKMSAYGESVQFSGTGTVEGPNYQVINSAGKKICFNSGNLLIQPDAMEFTGKNSVLIYTLAQIKTQLVQITTPAVKVAPVKRKAAGSSSPRGGSALAKAKEQIAIQKYEYYKSNRADLPSDIRDHSEEITRMMESGMSAELAFNEAKKLCFEHI